MGVIRLRHKLVLVFLAATLLPLAAILWMSSALMSRSLAFIATDDVSALAQSLELVGREYYRQARQQLRDDADGGRLEPQRFGAASRSAWPPSLQQFWDSGEADRFILSEPAGDRLLYAARRGEELWLYTASLDGVRMAEITRTIAETRARAGDLQQRDLPRGFTLALVLSSAFVWTLSLAHRPLPVDAHQPADPAVDDGTRSGGCGTIRDPAAASWEQGRGRAGGRGLQRDGRPAAAEPRAPGLPDAGGELADAGAQDGARVEELADADSADRRGDRRATVVGRPGVLRAGRRDRRGRGGEPGAPGPRVLGVCR